jgi:hypothetical protein
MSEAQAAHEGKEDEEDDRPPPVAIRTLRGVRAARGKESREEELSSAGEVRGKPPLKAIGLEGEASASHGEAFHCSEIEKDQGARPHTSRDVGERPCSEEPATHLTRTGGEGGSIRARQPSKRTAAPAGPRAPPAAYGVSTSQSSTHLSDMAR